MRTTPTKSSFKTRPEKQPRQGVHPGLFYSVFGILCLTNMVTAVAFLMSPDIAQLVNGHTGAVRQSYMDRIVQLRQEVDRLHSRQYAQAGNLNLQLQELSHQHDLIAEQHEYVRALAGAARDLGIDVAQMPVPAEQPETTLITGAVTPQAELPDLEYVTQSIGEMMADNRRALTTLSESAEESTDTIVSALAKVGIEAALPRSQSGVGGPFEPGPGAFDTESLVDEANAVMAAFERFKAARAAALSAPIYQPLDGKPRISSSFGNRKDPFLNRSAFHSGIDFPAPRGTAVRSAGDGVVVTASPQSGYGNLVEIRHPSGLITRYGHLSKFNVREGQNVGAGDVIAYVGSTGRSTGPHLHFEVRRNDQAVNPSTYLKTGTLLAKFL